MKRSVGPIVVALLTIMVTFAGIHAFAPEMFQRSASLGYQLLGWSASRCSRFPIPCLETRFRELREAEAKLAVAGARLRREVERVHNIVAEHSLLAEKNKRLLSEARSIHPDAKASPDSPVEFAGRTYPRFSIFESQVKLLFDERPHIERQLHHATQLYEKLKRKADELAITKANITSQRELLPAEIESLRASSTHVDITERLEEIQNTLSAGNVNLLDNQSVITTTRDILANLDNMESLGNSTSRNTRDFEKFIESGIEGE